MLSLHAVNLDADRAADRRLLRLRLSALFYQECTVKDGAIEQTNFDSYDPMRITFSN
jgi:hypothetical protein